jgi:hypothetical protein
MNNIFSNRFFQGGIAITGIGLAFYAYQNFTGETAITDSEVTTAEISNENSVTTTAATLGEEIEANQNDAVEDIKTENAVNNALTTDNINTAVEETTDDQ